jgi:hypothetical protein
MCFSDRKALDAAKIDRHPVNDARALHAFSLRASLSMRFTVDPATVPARPDERETAPRFSTKTTVQPCFVTARADDAP